jgi:hypothetical protein
MAERILGLANSDKIVVIPDKPYFMDGGAPDISVTRPNIPVIALCYIHEGAEIPPVEEDLLADARDVSVDPDASEAEKENSKKIILQYQMHRDSAVYANWYLILVACTQVRELSPSNLEQFGKMTKYGAMSQTMIRFLNYFAASQDDLTQNEALADRFISNKYFEYHTSASSTPRLCMDAMDDADGLDVFTEEEQSLVRSAVNTPSSMDNARTIPRMTLIKARAILDANGTLPDTWYMGQRAVDGFSGSRYSAMVKGLKMYYKKKYDLDEFEDLNLSQMVSRVQELMANVEGNA